MKKINLVILVLICFSSMFTKADVITINGPLKICVGEKTIFTITGHNNDPRHNHTWSFTPSAIAKYESRVSVDITSFSVTPTEKGFIELRVQLTCDASSPATMNSAIFKVEVISAPESPSVIYGNLFPCANTNIEYSVDQVSDVNYIWEISSFFTNSKTDNANKCVVNFSDKAPTDLPVVKVKSTNKCGVSNFLEKTVEINKIPSGALSVIKGTEFLCENEQGIVYSITSPSKIDSYCWKCYQDPVFTIVENGQNATFNVALTTDPAKTVQKAIFVKLKNSCGEDNVVKQVKITKIPRKPSAINGLKQITENNSTVTYSTKSDYSDVIEWAIDPSNAATKMNDISGNNDSLILKITKDYIGQIKIKAIGKNNCGYSMSNEELYVTVLQKPDKATTPVGASSACVNLDNLYTTTSNYAISYEWDLSPVNAGILKPNDDKCTINWDDNFKGNATLRVRGVNSSGVGEWSNLVYIIVSPIPQKPLAPNGNKILCLDPPSTTYSSLSDNALTYEWELSPVNAGSIMNQNQNCVIDWDAKYKGKAFIRVKGVNGCGNSDWSEVTEINISSVPEAPTVIGKFDPCAGEEVQYSATNIDSVIWSVGPLNAYTNLKIMGKNEIVVNWAKDNLQNTKAYINSYIANSCGKSLIRTDSIRINRYSNSTAVPVLLTTIKPVYCVYDSVEVIFNSMNPLIWLSNNSVIATGMKNTIYLATGIREIFVTSTLPNNCYSTPQQVKFKVDEVKADFTSNETKINIGGQINFINNSIGATSYIWNFGDNSFTTTQKSPYHNYFQSGYYNVSLTVQSQNCSDKVTKNKYVYVTDETAIGEFENSELSVYPNPFTSTIHIATTINEKYKTQLVNISGKIVIEIDNNKGSIDLNTELLPKGAYFLKIQSSEMVKTFKIIKL